MVIKFESSDGGKGLEDAEDELKREIERLKVLKERNRRRIEMLDNSDVGQMASEWINSQQNDNDDEFEGRWWKYD